MAEDEIRYDLLTQDALRGVVRQVLARVQRDGLPGEHHLYIAFDTVAEGVSVSKRLKEQYPEEMTIVLQYQFWDLLVTNERFEVKLSFSNVPERLVVPFSAVKAFYDPSAQFVYSSASPAPPTIRPASTWQPPSRISWARRTSRAGAPIPSRTTPSLKEPPRSSCHGRRQRSCISTASARNSPQLPRASSPLHKV
jgi:hypothetical protein